MDCELNERLIETDGDWTGLGLKLGWGKFGVFFRVQNNCISSIDTNQMKLYVCGSYKKKCVYRLLGFLGLPWSKVITVGQEEKVRWAQ